MRKVGGLIAVATVVAGCQGPVVFDATTTTTVTTTTTTTSTSSTTLPPIVAEGRVVDPGGRTLAGAEVSLAGATGTTGPDGVFRLAAPAPGTLTVSKRGWQPVELPWDRDTASGSDVVLEQMKVRAVRIGSEAAGDDAHFTRLLDLARTTAVNALVFDTKEEGGRVVYDTAVTAAHEIGAVDPRYDPAERIAQAREAGLLTITRIVWLEDPLWVRARPEERLAGAWADPGAPGMREYAIDLAVEACALGFDEIQLDYIRYPAGRTATVSGQLDIPEEERVANIAALVGEARGALAPMGCSVSADIFGIVVSVSNDQGLGQRPEELSPHLDALSPMVYPSHYSPGWLGLPDPNAHPYRVTADALDSALPRVSEGAVLRPWLQAFWWTDSQIRESIQAAEDRDVGWMLWNVGSDFSPGAIPTDAEVAD